MIEANIKENDIKLRQLPHNIEAEQLIIGSFLNNNEYVNKIADFLLPEHFYIQFHNRIYKSIIRFMERGMIATPVSLKGFFDNTEFSSVDGMSAFEYLVRLAANAEVIIDIYSVAHSIYDSAIRRQLITIGEDIVNESYKENVELTANIRMESAEQKLFNLATSGVSEKGFSPIAESVSNALNKIELLAKNKKSISGISSKFIELDKLTGGLQNSDLLILAARPAMGKTSFAINIGVNAAEVFYDEGTDQSVAIFSLEMSADQIAARIMSMKSGIEGSKIRTGNFISNDDFRKLSNSSADISKLPLFIDDSPELSISAIRTRARRMKRQSNLSLIIIDYLQLVTSRDYKEINRVQEIGQVSQGLKALAKELNIPIIALSQLSRAVELREDKHPQLSDLRESGNIEQDADIVMFLYREEYYLNKKIPTEEDKHGEWQEKLGKVKNIAEISIAKHRNGPVGNFNLRFDAGTTSFFNLLY